jgi:beta-phosphoglucomutase
MSKIRTIFFDLDGTLIDSEPTAGQAIMECCKEWGIVMDDADAHKITGKKWDIVFEILFEKYAPPVSREEAEERILNRYREIVKAGFVPVRGAEAAVKSLAKDYRLGLVSGSHRREILWALDRLGVKQCFEEVFGAEDYRGSKPSPDGYLMALKHFNEVSERALVFEDSVPGIESARQANLKVIGVTCTNFLRHDLSQAHHLIHDLTEVTGEWVRNLKI